MLFWLWLSELRPVKSQRKQRSDLGCAQELSRNSPYPTHTNSPQGKHSSATVGWRGAGSWGWARPAAPPWTPRAVCSQGFRSTAHTRWLLYGCFFLALFKKKQTTNKQKPRMESTTRTHILSSHTSKGKNDASYIPLLNKTLHHARTNLLLHFYCSFLHYSVHLSGQTAASKWQLHKHLWENLIGTNYLLVVWDLRSRSSYFSWETPGEGVASFQKNELSYSLNESS